MLFKIVLTISLLVYGGLAQDRPKLSPKSETLVVSPGRSARISCYIDGDPSLDLMAWKKNSETIWLQSLQDREGDFVDKYKGRYSIEKLLHEGILEVALIVNPVRSDDLGTYTCTFLTNDVERAVFELYTHECSSVSNPLHLGDEGFFECQVHGQEGAKELSVGWKGASTKSRFFNYTAQVENMGKTETCEITAEDMDDKVMCQSAYNIKSPYEHQGISISPMRDGHGILLQHVAVVNLTCDIVTSPSGSGKMNIPEPTFKWVVNREIIDFETSSVLNLDVTQYKVNDVQTKYFSVSCSATGLNNIQIPAERVSFQLKDASRNGTTPNNVATTSRISSYTIATMFLTLALVH